MCKCQGGIPFPFGHSTWCSTLVPFATRSVKPTTTITGLMLCTFSFDVSTVFPYLYIIIHLARDDNPSGALVNTKVIVTNLLFVSSRRFDFYNSYSDFIPFIRVLWIELLTGT